MIAGIFVGGASARMGGQPKGRLLARDTGQPLIVRSAHLLERTGLTPVLVGAAHAYDDLLPEVPRLADAPAGVGPLGGLAALLQFAARQPPLAEPPLAHVLALGCDMPFVSLTLLRKLASSPVSEDVLAPRSTTGVWEPLCARYRVDRCAPAVRDALATNERSFQALFRRLRMAELTLSESERRELRDWDTPEDIDHEP